MEDSTVRVIFTPSGLEGTVAVNSTVLDAARELGADLDTVCGGRAICGRCQVVPSTGSHPKWGVTVAGDALSEPNLAEQNYSGNRPLVPGQRLGCMAEITSDVVVDIPPESQIHKQVVRKEVNLAGIVIDPLTELRYIEPLGVELGEDATATDRIAASLAEEWDVTIDRFELAALTQVHRAMAGGATAGGGLTVAVRDGHTVAGAWPGLIDAVYGIGVDIGSTTVAGHLVNLADGAVIGTSGRMNPQIRFGEDLMSRVSYVMMNPGGEKELTSVIRQALDQLIAQLVADAGITIDRVLEISLVGNPVMHHLLLGIDPTPLGAAPFLLATSDALNLSANDLDLTAPNARVYVGPCIAGHVGADTAAAILAEGPHRSSEIQLLVDVGTNAEIVLGNSERLYAASSPTGPAFEGAQISSGVRASMGAVERVRIDPESLEPRFKIIGSEHWSDEAAFADDVKKTGIIGICGSGIIEVLAEMSRAGIVDRNGVVVGAMSERNDRIVADGRTFSYLLQAGDPALNISEIHITQNDVRAIQLAKAALKAGIDLLMEHAGLTEVDDIRLAGAFGSHIDTQAAIDIDLIPPSTGAIGSPGNSAGSGAVRLVLSNAERAEIEATVKAVTKIETATEPRFQDLFVAAMGFPLAPLPTTTAAEGTRRRRRRRV